MRPSIPREHVCVYLDQVLSRRPGLSKLEIENIHVVIYVKTKAIYTCIHHNHYHFQPKTPIPYQAGPGTYIPRPRNTSPRAGI